MVKVILNKVVIAETEKYEVVEGNKYFPPESLNKEYFSDSKTKYTCPWKGNASYYNVSLPDSTAAEDVAWYYPEPKAAANNIKGYVAFDKSKVEIQD